jgi:cytochrome c biogenesis protein CcmG/thiol:disulfide interchange protein DsbE
MPTEKKDFFLYLIPVCLVLFLLFIIWQSLIYHSRPFMPISLNKPLPEFNLPILFNSDKRLTNGDLHGHVSLLNMWASWCSACHAEQDLLMEIRKSYPIYGILYNDSPRKAQSWLEREGTPYTFVALDTQEELSHALGVEGIPVTFVIDGRGIIRYRYVGTLTKEAWITLLLPIVKAYQSERLPAQ